jgi:hypothetical protein
MNALSTAMGRIVLLALATAIGPRTLIAQRSACAPPAPPAREWVRLCADGNGVAALRRAIDLPSGRVTIGDALRAIAERGGVSITLDASLPQLQQTFTLPGGRATVAEALSRVIEARRIEIDVAAGGALIVASRSSHVSSSPPPATPIARSAIDRRRV